MKASMTELETTKREEPMWAAVQETGPFSR